MMTGTGRVDWTVAAAMGKRGCQSSAAVAVAVWCACSCRASPGFVRLPSHPGSSTQNVLERCSRAASGAHGGLLRLRGGSFVGAGPGAFSDASAGVADEDEFFRKFGTGPGSLDFSASKFEIRPDSFNETGSLMDGMGMWDYPEAYRLLGEHFPARVGHRVRTSPFLRKFWASHNFTDCQDGWDHLSDRLGTVVGISDDGRSCEVTLFMFLATHGCPHLLAVLDRNVSTNIFEVLPDTEVRVLQVKWDDEDGREGVTDWYATGYLTNYFLSLAEDELQPDFPDDKAVQTRIAQLEEELRALRHEQGFSIDDDGNMT